MLVLASLAGYGFARLEFPFRRTLFVIVLLFGGAKLPKLARSLGRAQTEYKQGLHEGSTPSGDGDPAAMA